MQANLVEKKIFSISELNRSVKQLLETHFRIVWVEGEISNLSRPSSGHLYFTLKDAQAQVRCAMFRLQTISLPFEMTNGMQILAAAKISLYEGRGDYQLIIEHIEERGEGLLRRRFELLKNKLAKEGLFDLHHKKPLPAFPKRIGVVTSPTGAAIRDVLSVLKRRFASIPITIYPTPVQGELAPPQIAAAIHLANQRKECDVLIVCRGGGSLEDLFAFNEEIVARAIFNSQIPTVSGIGHQVDFTIADFVADHRAPTPSAAAELLSPNQSEYCQRLLEFTARLGHLAYTELRHRRVLLENCRLKFRQPHQLLQPYLQSIDLKEQALKNTFSEIISTEKRKLELLSVKLTMLNPRLKLKEYAKELANSEKMFNYFILRKINELKQTLSSASRALSTVSPLSTLDRGYSIVTQEGRVIDDIHKVKPGGNIQVEMNTGFLVCTVNTIIIKN